MGGGVYRGGGGGGGTVAQEVEDEPVDDFVGEGVFFLQQDADEDVGRAGGLGGRGGRGLLCCDFSEAEQRRGGVEHGDRDADERAGDNVRFA